MATSKLQVYTPGSHAARRVPARLGATLIHRYMAPVYVYVYTRKQSITARFTCAATHVEIRTCVRACVRAHARSLEPLECRPANMRVYASDTIPAMRYVSSRTFVGVRKNGRLISRGFFFFFSLPFSGTITRARIKGPLIEFFSEPAQTRAQRRVRVYFSHVFLTFAYLTPSYTS